jgi:hypothetical protein
MKFPVVAFLSAACLIAASPAIAKVSVSRAHQICEAAAQVLRPVPKSARADKNMTQSSEETIIVKLSVWKADGGLTEVTCTVNRETTMATLKPSVLGPSRAPTAP